MLLDCRECTYVRYGGFALAVLSWVLSTPLSSMLRCAALVIHVSISRSYGYGSRDLVYSHLLTQFDFAACNVIESCG